MRGGRVDTRRRGGLDGRRGNLDRLGLSEQAEAGRPQTDAVAALHGRVVLSWRGVGGDTQDKSRQSRKIEKTTTKA